MSLKRPIGSEKVIREAALFALVDLTRESRLRRRNSGTSYDMAFQKKRRK